MEKVKCCVYFADALYRFSLHKMCVNVRNREGFMVKDSDAQGSGSENGFNKGAGRNQSQRQGSESRQVRLRGDPGTESASTQIKVEARKSE